MTAVSRQATASTETPVFFPSGEERLFGIFTSPPGEARGTAVILLPGADHIPSINRNRLWVRLARILAQSGYHVLRFDYHGVGESTGVLEVYELERPFTADVEAAARWIRRQGVDRFVLVGICFGAGTALSCVGRVDGVRAVLACSHPVYELEMLQTLGTFGYVRRIWGSEGLVGLLRAAKRVRSYLSFLAGRARAPRLRGGGGRASRMFLSQVGAVAERRVPTLFLYGTEDGYRERFDAACGGRLGQSLARAGSTVEVAMLDGPLHELTSLDVQDAFIERVGSWLLGLEER